MLKAPMGNSGTGGERKICPAGSHTAVCFAVIDIGTQFKPSKMYGDKWVRQVMLRWELSDELVKGEDGAERPMVISQRYTLSMNERAALRKLVESWFARTLTDEQAANFDVHALAGQPCQVVITHSERDGRTYDNVSSVGPLPKRMSAPEQVNATVTYSLADGPPPADWPQWLRDLIGKSQEMSGGGFPWEVDKPPQHQPAADFDEFDGGGQGDPAPAPSPAY